MAWSQEAWRWSAGGVGRTTISVIEPPAGVSDRKGPVVPFGFARALGDGSVAEVGREDRSERDPVLWEGDGG